MDGVVRAEWTKGTARPARRLGEQGKGGYRGIALGTVM